MPTIEFTPAVSSLGTSAKDVADFVIFNTLKIWGVFLSAGGVVLGLRAIMRSFGFKSAAEWDKISRKKRYEKNR